MKKSRMSILNFFINLGRDTEERMIIQREALLGRELTDQEKEEMKLVPREFVKEA